VFNCDRYFDVFVEYAKASPNDILIRITAVNRGPDQAPLHLLPTIWFRNTWVWGHEAKRPKLVPTLNLVEGLRTYKDAVEIAALQAAMVRLLTTLPPGRVRFVIVVDKKTDGLRIWLVIEHSLETAHDLLKCFFSGRELRDVTAERGLINGIRYEPTMTP